MSDINRSTSPSPAVAPRQNKLAAAQSSSWGNLVQDRLNAVIEHGGKQILDAGCSTGSYVEALRRIGYECYGFDLLYHQQWPQKDSGQFLIGDILDIPFADHSYDTIICFEVLEHLLDVAGTLSEFHRVCRRNIVISVPNCEPMPSFRAAGLAFHHYTDPTHEQAFTARSLRSTLEASGFRVRLLKTINPVYPEILCLSSWGVPLSIAERVTRRIQKWPMHKQYFMTLLAVADKV